jgi:valyl-tRNA synthetase
MAGKGACMSELPKTFDPAAIEAKWYAHWESTGAFRPSRPAAEPYTIVMPPPNVTGSLHIGHALDVTLQDILIRHARLSGKDALWVAGTDHAGIATQMVVERQMALHQQKRTDFTRDEFIAKVWEWKAESGGTITQQLRRLGASCDWENERFTMDEGFSRAVTKVFVDLYNQGLLYRDKRLVNWDPHFKTAISDLEVETREVNGYMWHFKYPLAGGETYTYIERDADGAVVLTEERDYISIATTRPETMLGDGAVAVHPGDERYKAIVGKLCEIPVGPKEHRRLIPIITDEYPDPDFGSGAVKITGAHDQNDYGVAQRNGIPMYRLMDLVAAMRADGPSYEVSAERAKAIASGATWTAAEIDSLNLVPEAYRGLDRYEARKRVVADIDADGLMIKVEDKAIQQPFGDRSGVVIEPMLTDQWYVDAKTLAGPAIEAVRSGAIDVVPKSWEKTYFNWMENIQPWCVSRQLWWGHRIPAWYGHKTGQGDGTEERLKIFCATTVEEALLEAQRYYETTDILVFDDEQQFYQYAFGPGVSRKTAIWRDSDVLDTWFSSALWPFGTLGWPETPSPLTGEGRERERDASAAQKTPSAEPSEAASLGAPTRADPSLQPLPRKGGEASLLTRHYPGDILVSGFDILFFWDARMIMQGLHFMRDEGGEGIAPFKTLYLHGLVRAADGSKMSKSKGNAVDPLGLIDQYGADALRFFMAAMESQGRDIKMDESRVTGYRNFATKLWNAARFAQANGIGASASVAAPSAELAVNKWIIGEVVQTLDTLNRAFDDLRFDGMADAIYHFAWGTFCDWYLELIKPVLSKPSPLQGRGGSSEAAGGEGAVTPHSVGNDTPLSPALSPEGEREQTETRAVAAWVFDQILVMLHPFMPFITEELWGSMGDRGGSMLIHAQWPEPGAGVDVEAKAEIEWLIKLVSEIRATRNELNVPASSKPKLVVDEYLDQTSIRVSRNENTICKLARLASVELRTAFGIGVSLQNSQGEQIAFSGDIITVNSVNRGGAQIIVDEATFIILLDDVLDRTAERTRLTAAIAAITKERDSLAGRLNNPAFIEKAKPEAVEKARADHGEKMAEAERLQAALARLG